MESNEVPFKKKKKSAPEKSQAVAFVKFVHQKR